MSSFKETLRTIPRSAWTVGVLLSLLLVLPLLLGPMRFDSEMLSWPTEAKVGLISGVPVLIVGYSLLVGFIYADAKRRRMRHVMWAWLALVPYFVGVILYFILRDPLPTPCPRCGTHVPRAFAFCQGCGAAVHPTCPQCGKQLESEWQNCPHCGAKRGTVTEIP
ncbi:MAG: zinc ribbon domain-containing protein [Acidobacteriota bacterium]